MMICARSLWVPGGLTLEGRAHEMVGFIGKVQPGIPSVSCAPVLPLPASTRPQTKGDPWSWSESTNSKLIS